MLVLLFYSWIRFELKKIIGICKLARKDRKFKSYSDFFQTRCFFIARSVFVCYPCLDNRPFIWMQNEALPYTVMIEIRQINLWSETNLANMYRNIYCLLKVRQSQNDFFKPTILPKKWTNKFDFTMIPQVDLFMFIFWRKLKIPKR